MYGINKACEEASSALLNVGSFVNEQIDESCLVEVDRLVEKACMLRDRAYKSFDEHFNWAQGGYRSGVSAIENVTGHQSGQIQKAIGREELLGEFPQLKKLVDNSVITLDHINHLAALKRDNIYSEYLADNIGSLIENAPHVTAKQFSVLTRHWKFAIDNRYRVDSLDYDTYRRRTLSLYQIPEGSWFIEGTLDETTGTLLHKALEDITTKIWRANSKEQREDFEGDQVQVDALGYLAQGYLSGEQDAQEFRYVAPLTADITIDIAQLKTDKSVNEFVNQCAERKNLLTKAHSKKYLEQLLCDSSLSVPIKTSNQSYELGRRVRTAPTNMKKQLALENDKCTVNGCCVPARWCDAHHIHHWIHGGETKIENLVLLCRRHHTQVHNDPIFEHNLSKEYLNTS